MVTWIEVSIYLIKVHRLHLHFGTTHIRSWLIDLPTTFHLLIDELSKRTMQVLEDIFRSYMDDFKGIRD